MNYHPLPRVNNVDIVIGLQYGDEAKGKVTHHLLSQDNYDFVCRASGGPNAGHTIYHEGKKIVTHHIPSGIFYGIPSIIGSGCVINPITLYEEMDELEKHGIDVRSNLKIAYNCHIITPYHVEEDIATDKVGSTKRGIMPAYRDKYARIGVRAESISALQEFLCDPLVLLHGTVMIEGAQGFGLCPDHGDYPFVTSSPPSSAYALHSLGIPPQAVRKVWGAAKVYETYVGTKQFQPRDDVFKQVARYGEEYGSTTGRARQVNWIDIGLLVRSVRANGVTDIVFSKVDVLQKAKRYQLLNPDTEFSSLQGMQKFIEAKLKTESPNIQAYWSSSKIGF